MLNLTSNVWFTAAARKDLEMWLVFQSNFNGITVIRLPAIVESNLINMYTDSSDLGYGDHIELTDYQVLGPGTGCNI